MNRNPPAAQEFWEDGFATNRNPNNNDDDTNNKKKKTTDN